MFDKKSFPLLGLALISSLILVGCSADNSDDNSNPSQSQSSSPITPNSGEASLASLVEVAENTEKELKSKGFKETSIVEDTYEQNVLFSPEINETMVIAGNQSDGYSVQPLENAMINNMINNIKKSTLEPSYKIKNDSEGKWVLSDDNTPNAYIEFIVKNNIIIEYTLVDNDKKIVVSKISYSLNDSDKKLIKKTIDTEGSTNPEEFEQPSDEIPQPVE